MCIKLQRRTSALQLYKVIIYGSSTVTSIFFIMYGFLTKMQGKNLGKCSNPLSECV